MYILNGAQDQPQPDTSQLFEIPALEGSCPAALQWRDLLSVQAEI